MPNQEITENFLSALRKYLSEEISIDEAVREAGLSSRKQFQYRMKSAYIHRLLVVRRRIDPELGMKLREWVYRSQKIIKGIEVYVVGGMPDDEIFFSSAAEKLLGYLVPLLSREDKKEIVIGIISGTGTADLVEYTEKLWNEVIGSTKFKGKSQNDKRKIDIIAMCSTTLDKWDLDGNANISALRLAKILNSRLPDFEVTPYGISTELVVLEKKIADIDKRTINRKRLEMVDPSRLDPDSQTKSKLDILIAGVGVRTDKDPADSAFQKVIQAEGIKLPEEVVGDVGFWPINKEGQVVEIRDKDNNKVLVYSLITPRTMRELAKESSIVMLIARNHRRGNEVIKTESIRAAIKGGFTNVLVTDEHTANQLMRDPL